MTVTLPTNPPWAGTAAPPRGTPASPWFVHHRCGPARLRLFCFSYAGGSASLFQPWRAALDADIDLCAVQLPGRGTRMAEPAQRDLPTLVRQLAPLLAQEAGGPFALFGHSLGALLAFEVTRYLVLHQLPRPQKLVVSGADAPQRRSVLEALDEHDDDAMIAKLATYNGTPPEVLQHRELMQLLAPAIRADFAMAAGYRWRPGPPLEVPITVFAGRHDPDVAPAQAEAWQLESRRPVPVHWFDGDHFFIHACRHQVLAQLNAELAPAALAAARSPSSPSSARNHAHE